MRPAQLTTTPRRRAIRRKKRKRTGLDRTLQLRLRVAPAPRRARRRSEAKRSKARRVERAIGASQHGRAACFWLRPSALATTLTPEVGERGEGHGTARHGTEETETKARAGGRVVGRERGRNAMKAEGGCCSRQTREKVRAIESETHQQTARKSQQRSCVRRSRRRRPKEEERTEVDGRVERR